MSTPVQFIPPEFFGFPALGQAAGSIAEDIRSRRREREEKERQTKFDDQAFAEMAMQRGVTLLDTLGDTPENRALVLEQWRSNPILAAAVPEDADISAPASVMLENIKREALKVPDSPQAQVMANLAYGLEPGQTPEQALESGAQILNQQRATTEQLHNQLQTYREVLQGFKARGTTIGGAQADQAIAELDNTVKQLSLMDAQIANLYAQAAESKQRARATRADPVQAALLDEYVPIFAERGVAPSAVSALFNGAPLSEEQAGSVVSALSAASEQARQGTASDRVKLATDMLAAGMELPNQQQAETVAKTLNDLMGRDDFTVEKRPSGLFGLGGDKWVPVPRDESFKTILRDVGFPEQQVEQIVSSIENDLQNPEARAVLEVNLAQMPQSAAKSALAAVVQAKARELGVELNGVGDAAVEIEGETRPQTAPQAAPVSPEAPPARAPAEQPRAEAPTRLERLEAQLRQREEFFLSRPPANEQEERLRAEGTRRLQEDIAREKRVQSARERSTPREGLMRESEFRGNRR